MPKLPNYKKKEGRNLLVLTNQQAKWKDGVITFPKRFQGFELRTKADNLQQVRILPRNRQILVEVIYFHETEALKEENGRYLGIDIGLENLATLGNNAGKPAVILNGRIIKSINQYFNKQLSHYRSIAKRMNCLDYTKRMARLTVKRNRKIEDYMHKASKSIIEYAVSYGCHTIIIGNNKDWKRNSEMPKRVNQNFVGIPHQRLIEMIRYKAENAGLHVIVTEESYTSGTSFLDGEAPVKENYQKERRIHRGLFQSNQGVMIHADLNGAYQIIKKVVPEAFADGIEGVGLHPVRVDC